MFIVTVLFKIHAAHWLDFLPSMYRNAATSLSVEPGCRQFDVCEGEAGQFEVFLYEVYDTQADFTVHLGAPHFLQFNMETSAWVIDKKVQTYTRVAAAPTI
jgi:(4S)-4-hydroxy-5-phosphonooxypentane-2,3-dione isomerase